MSLQAGLRRGLGALAGGAQALPPFVLLGARRCSPGGPGCGSMAAPEWTGSKRLLGFYQASNWSLEGENCDSSAAAPKQTDWWWRRFFFGHAFLSQAFCGHAGVCRAPRCPVKQDSACSACHVEWRLRAVALARAWEVYSTFMQVLVAGRHANACWLLYGRGRELQVVL